MLSRYFIEHPKSVDESYSQHLVAAGSFGLSMLAGGVVCLVHALVPGLFVKTGSRIITGLHDRMVLNRVKHQHDDYMI